MSDKHLYPLILTSKLADTRAFYSEKLGCTLRFDLADYLQVQFPGSEGPELCFMAPKNAPSLGGAVEPFTGHGLVISIPIEHVDQTHDWVKARGVAIVSPPTDRPWRWRSFVCRDPNGVLLDFFRPIEQSAIVNAAS